MKMRGEMQMSAADCGIIELAVGELLASAKSDPGMIESHQVDTAKNIRIRARAMRRRLEDRDANIG